MNWLRRMFRGDDAQDRNPADDFWYEPGFGALASLAGIPVTADTALQLPVVLGCLKVVSETQASLPVKVFRRLPNGGRAEAPDHPLADLLALSPNAYQTAWEFLAQMTWWVAWYRNAYAEIAPGQRGAVDRLLPHHPSLVTPYRRPDGEVWYQVRDQQAGGRIRQLHASEMLHLRSVPFSADGLSGIPVVRTSHEVIGAALAVHAYGARFFKNDGQSGGILEHPSSFKDVPSRDTFMSAWRKARTAMNAHRDALLEFGIKYNRAQLDNEKAQMLGTREALDLALTRLWRVPPHKVGILNRATFSNIEQQAIEFVTDTMLPLVEMWEQKINADLIVARQTYFVEFNVAGLLRGDLKSRYDAFFQGRQGGWLSINDIRRMENMNPIPNGDDYLQPLNMAPAGTKPPSARAAVPGDLGL